MHSIDVALLFGASSVLLLALFGVLLYNLFFPTDDLQLITDKDLDYYAKTNKFCVPGSSESAVVSSKKEDK